MSDQDINQHQDQERKALADTRGEWRELLKLLKQETTQSAQQAEGDDEAVLGRIKALSTAALAALNDDAAAAATAAAPDREQLLELLFSTMKVIEAGGFRDIDYGQEQHGDKWCVAAARTAAAVLGAQQQGSSNGGSGSGSGGHDGSADNDGSSSSGSTDALVMLPWLVLFGRCCLYMHSHWQKSEMLPFMVPAGALQLGLQEFQRSLQQMARPGVDWWRLWEGCEGVFIAKKIEYSEAASGAADAAGAEAAAAGGGEPPAPASKPLFAAWLAAVAAWLQDSDTSAQLGAAGLSTKPHLRSLEGAAMSLSCLQQLQASNPLMLMGCITTINPAAGTCTVNKQPEDRDKQLGVLFLNSLYSVAVSLSVLPLSCGCNNPFCRNLEGVGEEAGKQGNLCAACHKTRYCSKACQKQHWKQHKMVCKGLSAACSC